MSDQLSIVASVCVCVTETAMTCMCAANYYTVAQDITFLAENGVTGLFQEAAYIGPGGDFAELNDYGECDTTPSDLKSALIIMVPLYSSVASRMMWEPTTNGTELSSNFLRAYYGEGAAPHVQAYMTILTDRQLELDYFMQLAGWEMNSFAPIFDVATVLKAGELCTLVHAFVLLVVLLYL